MLSYIEALLEQGFSADELRTMSSRNARSLLEF